MASAAMENLLRSRPAGWFPDYDAALLASFGDALDEGRRMQGSEVKKWVYGKSLTLLVAHPIGHRLPLVARYFDVGPIEMSGSPTSVKQTARQLGPSERMNADLGEWDRSLMNLPMGNGSRALASL